MIKASIAMVCYYGCGSFCRHVDIGNGYIQCTKCNRTQKDTIEG